MAHYTIFLQQNDQLGDLVGASAGMGVGLGGASVGAGINDSYYVVQSGDTLGSIARKFNTTVSALVSANNLANANLIYVGQRLRISSSSISVGAGASASLSGKVSSVSNTKSTAQSTPVNPTQTSWQNNSILSGLSGLGLGTVVLVVVGIYLLKKD